MFLTHTSFNAKNRISFEKDGLIDYYNFSEKFLSIIDTSSLIELFSSERNVVENERFWKLTGLLLNKEARINTFKFNSFLYKDKHEAFDNYVLKKINKEVKIGIDDWNNGDSNSEEIKKWIKTYNVQYFYSHNSSCLHHFLDAKNLKVIYLYNFRSAEEEELDIFLQMKNLHSLYIKFKKGTL